uniref:Uncharacterized protein n=1 Tax=Oryza glumipatula TaxID=40148 RepID=A0A0E0AQ13_9ORYZ
MAGLDLLERGLPPSLPPSLPCGLGGVGRKATARQVGASLYPAAAAAAGAAAGAGAGAGGGIWVGSDQALQSYQGYFSMRNQSTNNRNQAVLFIALVTPMNHGAGMNIFSGADREREELEREGKEAAILSLSEERRRTGWWSTGQTKPDKQEKEKL